MFFSLHKKAYDLIVPIGELCSCTQSLRKAGLQDASYPMDWLGFRHFPLRIDYLCNGFEGFLADPNTLRRFGENNGAADHLCYMYECDKNKLLFLHDFPFGVELEKSFPKVKEKYARRLARLYKEMKQSKTVLFVRVEDPARAQDQEVELLTQSLARLAAAFAPVQIDFLYITNRKNMPAYHFERQAVSAHLTLAQLNYSSLDERAPSRANLEPLAWFLKKNYHLNRPLAVQIKTMWAKVLSRVHPSSDFRKKMRRRYHF